MSTEKIPLVSVIIPMYNSAKFIPQTLESLLYQTLKDFEVIIVDDCSTDNSVEVVESYAPKFSAAGINLNLVELPKNTATPGLPRNIGVQVAYGKYIAFLDSDDFFTQTALEEFATLAEEYRAEIVHTKGSFVLWQGEPLPIDNPAMTDMNELTDPKNFSFNTLRFSVAPPTTEPVFETENLSERVNLWINWSYDWSTCTTFCKRDFLISNQICFSAMKTAEDIPFSFECLIRAKKYLSVPNVNYIVRPREGSISRDKPNLAQHLHKRIGALNDGCNELDRL